VSVIDELKGLEDRVARRMKELRPLVEEYRELEQVAQRLGVSPGSTTDTPETPRRTRRASRRTRKEAATGSGAPARGNGRREQLLAMVKERPGVTVREIGAELGVDPTSLYRIVHRLEREGALEKRGRELLPR
jgi:transposase